MGFDDIGAVALKEFEELAALRLFDAVLLEHMEGVFAVRLPLGGADAETVVRRAHIAPEIETRAAGESAELFDRELLDAGFGVEAATGAEAREPRILFQAKKKSGDDGRDCVISP